MARRLISSTPRLVAPPASSPAVRSVMRGNRKFDTGPETRLRSLLHSHGLRFRKQYPITTAAGTIRVDIGFPSLRLAVFVDGCFWHACPLHGTKPATHSGYWRDKLARNALRDKRNTEALRSSGWQVLRVWEHMELAEAAAKVEEAVQELASKR